MVPRYISELTPSELSYHSRLDHAPIISYFPVCLPVCYHAHLQSDKITPYLTPYLPPCHTKSLAIQDMKHKYKIGEISQVPNSSTQLTDCFHRGWSIHQESMISTLEKPRQARTIGSLASLTLTHPLP